MSKWDADFTRKEKEQIDWLRDLLQDLEELRRTASRRRGRYPDLVQAIERANAAVSREIYPFIERIR